MSDSASDPPSSRPGKGRQRRQPAEREVPARRRRRRASSPSKPKERRRRKAAVARPTAPPAPTGWRNPRTRLGASGIVLIAGLLLVSLGPSELGAGLTLLGAMAFFYSIHRFGRLGTDPGGELL